jgi:putative hydrolase of the HAD superfamily
MAGPILAVTFDVWETLIHDPVGAEAKRTRLRAYRMAALLQERGITARPADLVEAYYLALPGMEATWAKSRDFDTPEQVSRVLSALPDPLTQPVPPDLVDELAREYASAALEYPPEIWPDTRETLAEVASRGYRIGLVCNTGRTPGWVLRRLFEGWGILDRFEALAFSNETGVRKPDPAMFLGVLNQLGTYPRESLHVGDDVITDIAGAKAIGMRAALVQPDSPPMPVAPDARLARLGDLIPLLDCSATPRSS